MIALDRGTEAFAVADIHCHIGPTAEPGKPGDRIERLLATMDSVGVDHACVFASTGRGSDYPLETEMLLKATSAAHGRIVPFARAHPYWGVEGVQALRSAAEAGVRGLKLHPFMDGAFQPNDPELVHPLVKVAAEFGLVVLVHSGWGWNSAPGFVADLARSFPGVSIVMGHSGRYGYHREAALVGADLPNLYFDTAGLATPGPTSELAEVVGPERVLFGSDHPYTPMGFELEKIARWGTLTREAIAQIVGGNLIRLLDLETSGAGAGRTIESRVVGVDTKGMSET